MTPNEVPVKTRKLSLQNGFSLIELMITVSIVAILAAIAVPSYTAFTRSTNRTDATKAMTFDAQALERCYSQSFTYIGCAAAPAGTANTTQGYYSITIATPTASSFTITATPIKAPQTGDSACAQFTLNSAGTQGAENSSDVSNNQITQTCWGST
jgi:type IV pilus assembly protein PilE